MLKLLFTIFFISPGGKCQDAMELTDLVVAPTCIFPPLAGICAIVSLVTTIFGIFSNTAELSVETDDSSGSITDEVSDLRKQMEQDHFETMMKLELITDLVKNLPVEIKLNHQEELLSSFVNIIHQTFKDFLVAIKQKEVMYLKQFADQFFSYKLSHLDELRHSLFPLLDGLGHEGFFPTLTRFLTYENRVCTDNQSIQETLISTWRMIMKAELKLYFLVEALYSITLREEGKLSRKQYKKRIKAVKSETNKNILAYARAVRDSLEETNHMPHESCDPENNDWIEDESFIHLYGLYSLETFDDNANYGKFKCLRTVKEGQRICDKKIFSPRVWCPHINACCSHTGQASVCISETKNFKLLGPPTLSKADSKDASCPRWTDLELEEVLCVCSCELKLPQVYTGEMKVRASDNYVVTGVRFKRNNDNVLFLQPQEGKLDAYGEVSDFSWVDLPSCGEKSCKTIDNNYTMIFMSDLRLPQNYVITGIGFGLYQAMDEGSRGLFVVVRGMPYNYQSGKLFLDRGNELIFGHSLQRNELELKRVNPMHIDMTLPNRASSLDYNYVSLSSLKDDDDDERLILPLINANPVTSKLSPLTGIRIFHKGSEEHAGFISLGVYQADYVQLLDEFIEIFGKNGTKIWKDGIMKQDIFV